MGCSPIDEMALRKSVKSSTVAFVFVLISTLISGVTHPENPVAERPNILFIISDDLNTRIGPYVDPGMKLHTPNLDRLASEGVRFMRAYSQYPVCGPSRASIMSGMYPETIRVTNNAFETGNHKISRPDLADHPSLAGFFRENGYYTARVSKIFHMGVPGGIERGEVGSDDPDSWDYAVNIMAPETLTPGNLERLSRGTHFGGTVARMILPDGDELTQADVLATNQAIAILENRAIPKPEGATNRTKFKEDAPFFLAVGLVRPHLPFIAPERHFERYPESEAYVPEVPEGDLEDVPQAAQSHTNASRFQMSDQEQRQAVAAYHASVSFMDEQVGRLLDALDRLSLRENTIVVFLSDHGFNLGEHTSWQKTNLWEESVRVPLILSVPGMEEVGTEREVIVELIDLYPTLADLVGMKDQIPAIVQGQSLAPILTDPAIGLQKDYAYTITSRYGASLKTNRWRYNRWGEEADTMNEELYDHDADPGEFTNLARDTRFEAELDAMRTQFEAIRERVRH